MHRSNAEGQITMRSPVGVPNPVTIIIRHDPHSNASLSIEIIFAGLTDEYHKRCSYMIPDNTHDSYLDFFEQLSKDYGLRVPHNRQPVRSPSFKAKYREVLNKNLDPGILYGYGDPAVIQVTDKNDIVYYLVATSNDAPGSFPILKSTNLTNWSCAGFVFPQGQKPVWAANGRHSDYWAPEMHKIDNEFRLYFVARDKDSGELCIGMARSSHPELAFKPEPKALLNGNVIDPHVFVEGKNAYLFWKEDNNDVWPAKLLDLLYQHPYFIPRLFKHKEDQITASFMVTLWPWAQTLAPMERFQAIQLFIEAVIARYAEFYNDLKYTGNEYPDARQAVDVVLHFMKTPMYAQQLTADGVSLTGGRVKIIENDLAWEAHLVEGMWLTKHKNKYYLFYAGNDFSTDQYGIGVAIADSPLGLFKKMDKPLLQSTAEWLAPGHPSVIKGPDGLHHMFFHAYYPGEAGYKKFRALLSVPLILEANNVLLNP